MIEVELWVMANGCIHPEIAFQQVPMILTRCSQLTPPCSMP